MEIKVNAKNEYYVYPDAFGNLELPEKDRFVIVLAKRHKIIQQSGGVRYNGEFDIAAFCKKSFLRIENAPLLDFGKLKRALEFNDIFEIPELESVANAIFDKINDISNGVEIKN